MILLDCLIVIVSILTLAYFRVSTWVWIPVVAAVLFGLTLWGQLGWLALIFGWSLFFSITALFSVTFIRYKLLSKPIFEYFKHQLPRMSDTEREALEAGDVWWEGELFSGKPRWSRLFDMVAPRLTTAEKAFLDNQVSHLCKMLGTWDPKAGEADLPAPIWDYIKQEGFLGMVIPQEFGGLGFSAYAHSSIIMKIATCSVSAAVSVMVPNSLGPAELLQMYGTSEQQQYYLPRLAKGEDIPCFALTGVTSGSDAANMLDRGVVCMGDWEGAEVIGIRLTFNKRYITLAPIATLLGIAIDLHDPEALLSAHPHPGITLCLIPLPHPGIEREARHQPIGSHFMNGPVRGRDVFIPAHWIIGNLAKAGQGWRMLMECLSVGRGISLPALATANAQLSYRTTSAYAVVRQQFKCAIGKFEGVQAVLARIGGLTYLLEGARIATVAAIDQKIKPSLASAILKYHSTEMGRKIINDAMDIHAGRAVQVGPRNYLAQAYQTLPIGITVEGANILTRNLIIFGQGALRCHPYLHQEMVAATTSSQDSLQGFDALLRSHMGYALRNIVRTWILGLSNARFVRVSVKGNSAYYLRKLARVSSQLALLSDVMLLILGGQLKRRERISARLGDILSALYLASTSVKYYYDHRESTDDEAYIAWVVQYALAQSYQAIDELLRNFPLKGWLGRSASRLLRFICFPLGHAAYAPPSDHLETEIATHMLKPSKLRDRMTAGCYSAQAPDDAVAVMDNALQSLYTVNHLQQKLYQALSHGMITPGLDWETQLEMACQQNILTTQEANRLRECENARWEALQVDEFPVMEIVHER